MQDDRLALYQRECQNSPQIVHALQELPLIGEDAISIVCRYVLAPALGGFTQWLLKEACKAQKQRLYFLARDGYLMYRAALLFCEKQRLPIECRYLSCSRYSLRIPIFHLDTEAALAYLCRGSLQINLERILTRAGLTADEKEAVFQELSLPYGPTVRLSHTRLAQIHESLRQCSTFLAAMNRHSAEAMPALKGYLSQEGLLEDRTDAIVDSGWTGSMQMVLNEVLSHMGRIRPLSGYYWGLYELPVHANRTLYHCYDFSPTSPLKAKVFFNNCLFEAIFTAPHGMTTGYRKLGDQYVPHYGFSDARRNAFVERIEAEIFPYIERLAEHTQILELSSEDLYNDRTIIQRLLQRFMAAPSPAEVACFGSLPFSDDVLEGEEQPIAFPLTEKELIQSHPLHKLVAISGRGKLPPRESAWYEGSVVRCGKHIRYHLWQYTLYQWMRYSRKRLMYMRGKRRDSRYG